MNTKGATLATFVVLALLAIRLDADITITIVAPQLKPGMAKLQTMLENQVQAAADGVAAMAEAYLSKPLLMSALAQSNGTAALPDFSSFRAGDVASVALGSFAAVQTDTWDTAVLSDRLDNFAIEDDYPVGAGARPLALDVAFPLGILGGRLSVRVSASFMQAEVLGYTFRSLGAGATAGCALLLPRRWGPSFRWDGVSASVGAVFGQNRLTTVVAPGTVEQTLSFDPDGAGPLPVYDVVVQVDPEIEAAVASTALVFPVSLSSGISLFDTFSLTLGGGMDISTGATSISLDGAPEIVIQGYLAELIETPGRIEVSGSVAQGLSVAPRPFAFGEALFRAGPCYVALCALFRLTGGLAAGICLGVSLR